MINAEALTKSFRHTLAVDNVSLKVEKGEIYGFLGLNGAGKTTTIRMLVNMISPSSGSVALFNKPFQQVDWNDVGYLVETPHAYPNLSVKENLKVVALLRNLNAGKCVPDIIEKLQLGRFADTPFRNLSLGNQQRVGLAKALMHHPALLILDEPINGLDPAGIAEVRELLRSMAVNGTTVFLSSHILSEVSKLATRIGILHNGRLVTELRAHEIGDHLKRKLVIKTSDNAAASDVIRNAGYKIQFMSDVQIELVEKDALGAPDKLTAILAAHHLPPKHVLLEEEDLESLFLRLITT